MAHRPPLIGSFVASRPSRRVFFGITQDKPKTEVAPSGTGKGFGYSIVTSAVADRAPATISI